MRSEGESRTGWGREFQSRGAVRDSAAGGERQCLILAMRRRWK